MDLFKKLFLVATLFFGVAAYASSGTTVVNRDTTDHILLIEDEEENITEMVIAAGQTLTDLCQTECYIYLKGSEDFEYADGTPVVFAIINGRLMIDDNQG